MNATERLGEERIPKLLWEFSLPVTVGILVSSLYNIIDRIFIGHSAGALGIAGITVGYPIMVILAACASLVGVGATSLLSIKLGESKTDEIEEIIGNALLLLIIFAVIIMLLGLLYLDPILIIMGASQEVLPYARDYMTIILYSTIFQLLGLGMNHFIRAEGQPAKAMATQLIGAALNIVLAPVFIYGLHWGIKGAALATAISQFVSAAWVMFYFFGGKRPFKIRLASLTPRLAIISRTVAIGASSFAMLVASSLFNFIMNVSLSKYGGDIALSSMGAAFSIFLLILIAPIGISQGVQPIIGFNYGAQKYDRVIETLKLSIIAATLITTVGFMGIEIFAAQLMAMFNEDRQFVDFGSYAMRIYTLALPILGFQYVGSGYFQAVGKPKQAMFLTLARQVIFLIPALLIFPVFFEMLGVLLAAPISDLLSAAITGICLYVEIRNLNQKHRLFVFNHTELI